ncbi:SPOR domain-containing protein [Acidithiobacillus sp.]|uniref:SPOR domain-containing protein n=1 Tax=Acidithiobacillus sp. TaxID=1872118 RepID=UPI00261894AB|nr:SPOR domain-containing protein [Acidithiobacillus sp.]MDD5279393.1 septal ring lytic transglycosylase RlpA family protein [Acidithiobacillus sp.]
MIKPVAHSLYGLLSVAALLISGCAGVSQKAPQGKLTAPAAAASCSAPAPTLRAAYNRSYQIHGRLYHPLQSAADYNVRGLASWYGWESGSKTSMGTPFRPRAYTAASRDLPLPTCARVTNLSNGRSIVVLVNDRGPFVDGRSMDLSYGAASALGMTHQGTAAVQIVALAPSSITPTGANGSGPSVPMHTQEIQGPTQTYLQTGAFKALNHATAERNHLISYGFLDVLIVPGLVKGQQFYKVQVGPLPDGIAAVKAVAAMKKMGFHDFYPVEQ